MKITQAEVASHKNEVVALQSANKELNEKLANAEGKLNDLEQYSRCDNLVLSCIPASAAEIAAGIILITEWLNHLNT